MLLASAQGYDPLVALPGVTEVGKKVEIGAYLADMMKFIVALAGVFAIIVAIIGGTQYVAAGISPNAKNDAKERMINAFIGLTLVLVSWLILNSINPKLVILNFKLPPVTGTAVTTSVLGASTPINTQGVSVAGCPTCVNVSGLFPQKAPGAGCAAGNICQIDPSVAEKLINLNNKLKDEKITWEVTEMWPPTRAHQDPCHQAATCVDAALRGGSVTPANIKTFVEKASSVGLTAVYEVKTQIEKQILVNRGVPPSMVLVVTQITSAHFSVYNK